MTFAVLMMFAGATTIVGYAAFCFGVRLGVGRRGPERQAELDRARDDSYVRGFTEGKRQGAAEAYAGLARANRDAPRPETATTVSSSNWALNSLCAWQPTAVSSFEPPYPQGGPWRRERTLDERRIERDVSRLTPYDPRLDDYPATVGAFASDQSSAHDNVHGSGRPAQACDVPVWGAVPGLDADGCSPVPLDPPPALPDDAGTFASDAGTFADSTGSFSDSGSSDSGSSDSGSSDSGSSDSGSSDSGGGE